jgi:hypothetical protein
VVTNEWIADVGMNQKSINSSVHKVDRGLFTPKCMVAKPFA